uniref:hypothetical protein n=1 Tax=uncultured Duncaniella sp. TaxID=2768039 RepID=UPI002639E7F8
MAFKKVSDYNSQRFDGLFVLRNDGDYADVVFLYQSVDDVLVADTHYLKTNGYSGYVHCCGTGCPACNKNIRVQTKLFIPLYNITAGNVLQFWDRGVRFESQLQQDVFSKFANPSQYVFRIIRHGMANDMNTTYEIMVAGQNNYKSYDQILADYHTSSPAFYEHICRDMSVAEMATLFSNGGGATEGSYGEYNAGNLPNYAVTPRS